jgi:CBS domain-containing protein
VTNRRGNSQARPFGESEITMFKAKDIMTTHVVSVASDDTVDRAVFLMIKHRVSGLPVLDKQGCPIGIVSEYDLLELICEGHSEQALVSDYMSRELIAITEEDSWVTIADLFRLKHVRRLPVLREGLLVGVVSRHDLMHAVQDARRYIRQQLPIPDGSNAWVPAHCAAHTAVPSEPLAPDGHCAGCSTCELFRSQSNA